MTPLPAHAAAPPEALAVTVIRDAVEAALYAEVVLPALLWPGNLPAVAGRARLRYLIHADAAVAADLEAAPALARLRALAEVALPALPPTEAQDGPGDALLTACLRQDLAGTLAGKAAVLLLSPRQLYADGSLAHAWDRLAAGSRAIMLACLPVDSLAVRQALGRNGSPCCETPPAMPPQELCALGVAHRLSDRLCGPSAFFFDAGAAGGLLRCFAPSPLLVRLDRLAPAGLTPQHPGYLLETCPASGDIHLLDASDDALGLCLVDSSDTADEAGVASGPWTAERLATWAREATNWQQRRFFDRSVRLRTAEPDRTGALEQAETQAATLAEAVLCTLAPPPLPAAVHLPANRFAPGTPERVREPDRPFAAFMDFAASPYALGDFLTWNVRVCCEALAAGANVVDVVALTDPDKLGNIFQDFANKSNYLRFFLDLLPAYYTNPMLRHFRHVRDRGAFERLMERARAGGQGQFPGFKKYEEGLRAREARYYGHWFMNRFYREHGFIPGLTVPPAWAAWARAFRTALGPGTLAVTVHVRRREADTDLFGCALERDGDFAVWEAFFTAMVARHPEVRFLLLGKPSEWPRRLLCHPAVTVLKTLGCGLMEELAMIQAGDLFMGLLSGPSTMAFFSDTPYALFVQEAHAPFTVEVLEVAKGFHRLPFAGPGQQLIWEPPSFARLVAAFEEQYAALREHIA